MTIKQRKRLKRADKSRKTVKSAANMLVARLPEYCAPLFTRDVYRYKVFYGGRGGARSWSMARALLILAAQTPMRILCTREYQTSIKDSVHKLLQDQITLMGLGGYEVIRNEIRHANGSLFIFEGLRTNVHTIKSLEGIDICWVEEAERISKESWDVLIPTIRKDGSEIWVSFNPDQEDDSTYVRFVKNTPPRTFIKRVSWEDNPYLTKVLREEKDYAYKVDPESAAHVWGGDTRLITKAMIFAGKWIVEEFVPVPVCPYLADKEPCPDQKDGRVCTHAWSGPYQGMDFGFAADPNAATRSWVYGNVLYIEYEWYRMHLDNHKIVGDVLDTIPDFQKYVTRADSARPDTISYLRQHGLPRIISCKKGPNSIEDGIAHIRSYERVVLHPRCKHVKDEFKAYSYKVDERSQDVLPIVIDKHNHTIDGIRYALEPLIKVQRKTGVVFPKTPDVHSVVGNAILLQEMDEHNARAEAEKQNGNGHGHAHNRLIGINSR